jgi:acetone carboxylase, alpha subunit
VPDRRVLKINKLEQRILELEKKYGEEVTHKS